MKFQIIKDLATLTGIPEYTLEKLNKKLIILLSDYTQEALFNNDSLMEIDMGYGKLFVEIDKEKDSIRYKFIPSMGLEKALQSTIIKGENLLVSKADESLAKKIVDIYKEII